MPELPEVETVVRGLRAILTAETIARVRVTAPVASIVVGESLKSRSFAALLRGRRVRTVDRRGKNILIRLSGDLTLWVHLKMTGKFLYQAASDSRHKHDLVIIDLNSTKENGHHLRFNDYRRFGRLRLFRDGDLWEQPGLRELGPEPFDLSAEQFAGLCRRRPRMLKPALLDQSFLAGLGNIYADESLYYSRLHPRRLTSSISTRKLVELHGHIQRLLRQAINKMGTSVDSYRGIDGQSGSFQNYLKAYSREGEPCGNCGRSIVREKISSRSAHYCPGCQRFR